MTISSSSQNYKTISTFNEYLFKGDWESAYQAILPSLEQRSPSAEIISAYLLIANKVDMVSEALSMAHQYLAASSGKDELKLELLFNLANLYDSLGEYGLAFKYADEANRLKNVQYDYQQDSFLTEEIKKVFSSKYQHLLNTSENPGKKPLYILGMPRSGTSLLEQSLDMHSSITGLGELDEINRLAWSSSEILHSEYPYPYLLWQAKSADLNRIAEIYLSSLSNKSAGDTSYFIDKMPHNYHHIGFIRLLFPESTIIHTIRNPLDTCLSIWFKDFIGQHNYAYRLEDIAKKYLLYRDLMAFWRNEAGIDFIDIVYEEWVKDPREKLSQLLEHLDLPWEDSVMEHQRSERKIITASYSQVREKLNTKSVERWRNYEPYLSPLFEGLESIL